jgi:hypothetical protein
VPTPALGARSTSDRAFVAWWLDRDRHSSPRVSTKRSVE